MNRLLVPASGEVRVNGQSIRDIDVIRLRPGIGYVIQDAGLFPHFTTALPYVPDFRRVGIPDADILETSRAVKCERPNCLK